MPNSAVADPTAARERERGDADSVFLPGAEGDMEVLPQHETLVAQLDATGMRERHLRAAQALLSGASDDLDLRMEAGWHLLHGGEERRGADMLADTARARWLALNRRTYQATGRMTEKYDVVDLTRRAGGENPACRYSRFLTLGSGRGACR